MTNPIEQLLNEATAELSHTRRWSYWKPVISAAWIEHQRMAMAFDYQTRELEIALEFLTPEVMTEFRRKAHPTLHP